MSRPKPRIRALVLSASRGRQLRPLTTFLPPALLPVRGVPALRFSLEALAKVGCEAVAVDVEHLSDRIESAFGDSYREMEIHYSRTDGAGTWGAAGPLRDFFSDVDAVVILDGNAICRWPLKGMIKRHLKKSVDATLLLSTRASLEQHGGGVAVDKDGRVLELRSSGLAVSEKGVRRHVFMGAQVLDPSLLARIPPQGELVKQLYEPLLMNGGSIQILRNRRGLARPEYPGVLSARCLELGQGALSDAALSPTLGVEEWPGRQRRKGQTVGGGEWRQGRGSGPSRTEPRFDRGHDRRRLPSQAEHHCAGSRAAARDPRCEPPGDSAQGRSRSVVQRFRGRRSGLHPPCSERMTLSLKDRYRLVVFDWDGTLRDSVASIVDCGIAALADAEIGVGNTNKELEERIRSTIGLALRDAVPIWSPEVDERTTKTVLERYRFHWLDRYHSASSLFEDVPELLHRLEAQGFLLAVATGKSRVGLERDLAQAESVRGYFAATRTADETAVKPSPVMLLELMEELGCRADETLMVGDTTHDLLMAGNAGVDAVGVLCGAMARSELEPHCLALLEETMQLPELLS